MAPTNCYILDVGFVLDIDVLLGFENCRAGLLKE